MKAWVWSSEIIFLTQFPFILSANRFSGLNPYLILARFLLILSIVSWVYSDLPWIIFIIAAYFSLSVYKHQISKVELEPGFETNLTEFVAFFSVLNFIFVIPFWGDDSKKLSRIIHFLINIIGIAVVIYSLIRNQLLDGWSCYSAAFYPSISDYRYGVCPPLGTYTPICSNSNIKGIHCDDRRTFEQAFSFHQIGTTLFVASGTIYIFGCPFF